MTDKERYDELLKLCTNWQDRLKVVCLALRGLPYRNSHCLVTVLEALARDMEKVTDYRTE